VRNLCTWKPIKGFEKEYLISDTGKVFSIRNNRELKVKINVVHGYCEIELNVKGKVCYKRVHRLVAQTFIPNPNNYSVVNHKDGVKTNNCVSNLEWVTPSENNRHAFRLGLAKTFRYRYLFFTSKDFYIFHSENEACKAIGLTSSAIGLHIKNKTSFTRGKLKRFFCVKFPTKINITFNDYRKLVGKYYREVEYSQATGSGLCLLNKDNDIV
jgi:hypothetical protein